MGALTFDLIPGQFSDYGIYKNAWKQLASYNAIKCKAVGGNTISLFPISFFDKPLWDKDNSSFFVFKVREHATSMIQKWKTGKLSVCGVYKGHTCFICLLKFSFSFSKQQNNPISSS